MSLFLGSTGNPAHAIGQILTALASIQQQQHAMVAVQMSIQHKQQSMAAVQDLILQRVSNLEQQRGQESASSQHQRAPGNDNDAASEAPWPCPLCPQLLMHRHSFKGHIRRLVRQSSRPKCHLNPRNPLHHELVHRFNGHDFYAQSQDFCQRFHDFVSRAISKSRSDHDCRMLVQSWLSAARATDERLFPTCNYSSGHESDPISQSNSSSAELSCDQ